MTELEEYLQRAQRKAQDRRTGRAFDTLFSHSISPEREVALMAQPIYTFNQQPLQDPATGLPYYMVGIDPLSGAPLGG